jgi:hypothetical protein
MDGSIAPQLFPTKADMMELEVGDSRLTDSS